MSTASMSAASISATSPLTSPPRPPRLVAGQVVGQVVGGTGRPRLRLTSRGRGVLTTLAAAPLVIAALALALNGGGATASLEGSPHSFEYVTVGSGESLWQVAEAIAPGADPRDVIERFVELNRLESAEVLAGQRLAIPAQYKH